MTLPQDVVNRTLAVSKVFFDSELGGVCLMVSLILNEMTHGGFMTYVELSQVDWGLRHLPITR